MKRQHIFFSVLVLTVCSLFAMESPYTSGPEPEEEMEIVPEPTRKRSARKEVVAIHKRHKVKHVNVEKTKDIVMPTAVYDPETETVHEQIKVIDRLDLQKREYFTQRMFETLINVRAAEDLSFIVAQVTTKVQGVEHKDYFDAYRLLDSIFSHDPDILRPAHPRARDFINPLNNLPSVGDIEFFIIPDMHARAFTYLGSAYELYEDKHKRPTMLTIFEENDPSAKRLELKHKAEHDYSQGQWLRAQNKLEPAIANLKKVLQIGNPHYDHAAIELGNIYLQQKDYDEAVRYFELVAKRESAKKFVANYLLGVAYVMKKDYAAALPYLLIAIQDTDQTLKAKSEILLGESYMAQGKYADALKYFFAASISPDLHQRFDAFLHIGILNFKHHKYEQAQSYFDFVVKGGIGVSFDQQQQALRYLKAIKEHSYVPLISHPVSSK